jgi:FixJ family two-component response regulator
VAKPGTVRRFVVLAGDDPAGTEAVGRRLLQLNTGALVVYGRLKDVLANPPAGQVAAVIVDTHEPPAAIRGALEWLRHRWSRCPITVIGDAGGGDQEMAARQGGACFLTRPVTEEQWSSLLSHALSPHGVRGTRETPAIPA